MRRRELRVLVLAPSSSFHTERFVAELRRQGCRVLVASLERGRLHHFRLARRGPHRWFHYALAAIQVRALAMRFRADVLNPHYAAGYGFTAALADLGRAVPIALNLWGGDVLLAPHKSFFHRLKPALALRAADCVFGDSRYIIQEAERLARLRSTRVIPWGIERDYLGLHKTSYRLGRPLRIIVPRRQEPLYNNEFILRALDPLLAQDAVAVTFARFGDQAALFEKKCGEKRGNNILFYDRMPRSRFLSFMAEHDVYLSAAGTDSSPASLIEAMGLGLLPIAADVPGVREWLDDASGFLFRPGDRAELVNLIEKLVAEDEAFERVRQSNLERVKREAIFENNVREHISVMRQLSEMVSQ